MGRGKQSLIGRLASRWLGIGLAPARPENRYAAPRRTGFEALEPRYAPATLGLGIRVLDDNAGTPGNPRTTPLQVGEIFWVQVLAEDQRAANPQGIISLPLDLSWDANNLQLLNAPTAFSPNTIAPANLITPDFPLNRLVDAFTPASGHTGFVEPPVGQVPIPAIPTLDNLRGASLPAALIGQAIGDNPANPADFGFFSLLRFQALAAGDDTPFTLQLAGSMAFADADVLNGIAALSPVVIQNRDATGAPQVVGPQGPELAVTEFLEIVAAPATVSLSGFVFADTNLNSQLDRAADGTPLEIGLPGVEIQLFSQGQGNLLQTTTTGPDGWYHFEGLPAGTYRIVEIQPAQYIDSGNSLGVILAPPAAGGGNPPNAAVRRGVAGDDQFLQIELRGGEHAVDYNFGENVIPTKNFFLSRSIPRVALNQALGLETEVVAATAANDQIDVQVTANDITVTVNAGAPQVFDRGDFDILLIDCEAGTDAVAVTGTDEDEVAHFQPLQTSLRVGTTFAGLNYGLLTLGGEQAEVTAGAGGTDLAVIRDTRQVSDALVSAANTATLTAGATRLARAIGFDRMRAVTFVVPGGAEIDTSDQNAPTFVVELAGSWTEI
jgi:hypothetical protein